MLLSLLKKKVGYHSRKRVKLTLNLIKNIYTKDSLYFRMPKVASDSIADGLGEETVSFYHFFTPRTTKRLILLNKKSIKFTFVREPLTRFISAYSWAVRDDICKFKYPEDYYQKKAILKCGGINNFCSQLGSMLKDPKNHLIHFYPQSDFLFEKDVPLFNFLGKYERMEKDIKELEIKYSIKIKFKFGPNDKNLEKKNIEDLNSKVNRLALAPSSIKQLESVYSKDYELLNYSHTNL
ncbi:MAG: sulfotransferase family 2 domain-containing protein [Colwellia sp.]|nr:sulfotransferase family 2 domain-containing protein [Colwellia sp.]